MRFSQAHSLQRESVAPVHMLPGIQKARHGLQTHLSALLLVFVCIGQGGFAFAESPFPGQTFTYSYPPADVEALTADRADAPRNRSDLPIVVKGRSSDLSDPSFIFFSTGNDCLFTDVYPVIAVYKGGEWNTISFPGARNHFWSHVYPLSPYEHGEHMYAISNSYCGDPGGTYIYHSADGGRSWTVSSIRMHYLSHFLSLRMEADGTGEIIVQSDNDPDPVGGHHVYRTLDWGDSWSEPEFSETILAPPARPSEYVVPETIPELVRAGRFTRPAYVPIPAIMESIAAEYARHRERR